MSILNANVSVNTEPNLATEIVRGALRLIGLAVRLPLLGVLSLLEPVVRAVLSIAMVLGIVVSVLFEASAAGTRFPFLAMLAASLSCGVALILYYGLVAWLSR